MLKPGEAAVLIVRRSEQRPDKFFFAVRRSETSSFDERNDFQIGPFQFPVAELGSRDDFESAINEAVIALKGV